MKQLLKKCLFVLAFIPLGLLAQTEVSGTITDNITEMPIPGVNIIVKGTTNGTTSDFDGNYTLSNLNSGDLIDFSYVGYASQEVAFTGQASINIALQEDASQLDEVLLDWLRYNNKTSGNRCSIKGL